MDGRLFLVRHLLILKEMTASLELGRKERRKEWAGIGDFLRSLLENATSILGYGRGSIATSSVSTPMGKNKAIQGNDARSDIDRTLKLACEALIAQITNTAISPIKVYLDKCTAYLAKPPSNKPATANADLSSQPFATPQKVQEVHEEFKSKAFAALQEWVAELRRYLADEETVKVLVPPAQVRTRYSQYDYTMHDMS